MALTRLLRCKRLNILSRKQWLENYYVRTARTHSHAVPSSDSECIITFSNGRKMAISSGKFARLADGCSVTSMGDTTVMVTAVSKSRASGAMSFVPLIVDYRQKAAAAGRIPTNFLKRELGPTENEILTSRLIDRSLRPIFPAKYNFETQVVCNMLAIDGINKPDVLSINGASAALALSDIPWNGPVGAVRLGLIDNEVVINPTRREIQQSSLDLIITAAQQKLVVMVEGSADNISQEDLKKAVKIGVKECQSVIQGILDLQRKMGKQKRTLDAPPDLPEDVIESVRSLSEMKLREIFSDHTHDKISRDTAVTNLRNEVIETMKSSYSDLDLPLTVETFQQFGKSLLRSLMFEKECRCDGRKFDQLRDISCKVDLFKPLHGSAMFQRGQTQVLCTVTLDSPDSALKMDTVSMLATGIKEKNFFLHYEFPSYATNETGRTGPLGRREIGHGALAERGLRSVIPKDYPFAIRLTSEVLESNGSSSMASVCGGSLALMDAGVPISSPVAGVAMGLITKYDQDSQQIEDYRILTDILGLEDYMGDMDFKIAGTKLGVTAVQADIKLPGIPLKVLMESIEKAVRAKSQILSIMNQVLPAPRTEMKDNMPVTESLEIPVHHRGKLLGVAGTNLKKIFLQTGVHISSGDDEKFNLFAPNQEAMTEAKEMINQLIKQEREPTLDFGGIYTAKIVEIRDIGVMVTLYPNMKPVLLPNLQLDQRKILHPSALNLQVGQEIQVKYFGRDPVSGSMRLSRKVLQTTNFVARNLNGSE